MSDNHAELTEEDNSARHEEMRRTEMMWSWYRRLRTASNFEISFSILSLFVFAALYWFESSRDAYGQRLIEALYDPGILFSVLFIFAETFTRALTGQTIVVGVYASRSKSFKLAINNLGGEGNKSNNPIHDEFSKYVSRSAEAFRVAQRRPNALLIVGTTVAMAGLLFFIVTLPGFHMIQGSDANFPETSDIQTKLIDLLPRLLMLIFIQVLAGFFLRQYRLSMEELRYFEAILRSREAQSLSYLLLSTAQNEKVYEFAKALIESPDRDSLRLQQGETTVILEAQKIEVNEFKGVYEKLFDFLKMPSEETATRK